MQPSLFIYQTFCSFIKKSNAEVSFCSKGQNHNCVKIRITTMRYDGFLVLSYKFPGTTRLHQNTNVISTQATSTKLQQSISIREIPKNI